MTPNNTIWQWSSITVINRLQLHSDIKISITNQYEMGNGEYEIGLLSTGFSSGYKTSQSSLFVYFVNLHTSKIHTTLFSSS